MTLDMLKGVALIGTFIGVLIIFAMWVSLWENVWQASVEPTRGAIYDAQLNRPASSRWRLVRAGTLVLVFSPTIRQQSRLLPQCHDAPWSSLDCFLICSTRHPVITGKSD